MKEFSGKIRKNCCAEPLPVSRTVDVAEADTSSSMLVKPPDSKMKLWDDVS
jgi:hypothetical protein